MVMSHSFANTDQILTAALAQLIMKSFFLASALLVLVRAGSDITPVAVVESLPALLHQSSQYHSQDSLGQYAYGYANDLSAKNEIRSVDGQTVGSYSYVDPEGKLQSVHYKSDALNGFRASATNLPIAPQAAPIAVPQPIQDTPEVIEARNRHLETLKLATDAAKAAESTAVEAKAAIHAHPAIITSTNPVVRSSVPYFGYSFAINYGRLYTIQPQPIVTAYAIPEAFIGTPLISSPTPIAAGASEIKDELPEVVSARQQDTNKTPAKE
ncbi:cuticle protein 19.8-like isoform X2 [Euwallacea fornicatus]|uniref:cuticle protein 19.8-like isoform X2 n=1 Tax=Euwallacea fornicatus TaxID=995702 RepID=UPI00338D8D73